MRSKIIKILKSVLFVLPVVQDIDPNAFYITE